MIRPGARTGDHVRSRIIAKADELFRAQGYAKTTIAAIAQALDVSPAYIYKFFESKNAVVEAAVERDIEQIRADVLAAAGGRDRAIARIENVVLAVLHSHRQRFENAAFIHELILLANEQKWACIRRWKSELREIFAALIEAGTRAGDFRVDDPLAAADFVMDSVMVFLHPLLLTERSPEESVRRARAHVRWIERALR
ncbi:TetR/AcrR family transcriptional regulator [Stella sp.]|uniref:TetR/AcrR family transcriptional regulator n=1 Tax=Stella sp. TaxID=2912054 RepID=UPI0035AE1B3D